MLFYTLNPLFHTLEGFLFCDVIHNQCAQGFAIMTNSSKIYAAVIDLYCYWPAKINKSVPVSQIWALMRFPSLSLTILEENYTPTVGAMFFVF